MYDVGTITGDHRFTIGSKTKGVNPMDLALDDMFGSSPKMIIKDETKAVEFSEIEYDVRNFEKHLAEVLQLEAVACKDWLTNKVDRCVGGRVAKQQCTGPLQLPLNNCGVMALDYDNNQGIATSIGHAPICALIDAEAGSRNSIGEALTNIVWAPLEKGIKSISLSANWMWACKNPGEDARTICSSKKHVLILLYLWESTFLLVKILCP
jgi:phosphoribosylformylglycinamidine synthase